MKKKLLYIGSIGLIISVFLFVVAARCLGDRESIPRPFTAFDLLIGEDVLPTPWQVDGTPVPLVTVLGEGDEDDSYVVFVVADSSATAAQRIYRLPSHKVAESVYDTELPYRFKDQSIVRNTPWHIPNQLSYVSPYTERQHIACTMLSNRFICEYLAQYEEFVTLFSSDIDESAMSLEQFNSVVEQIDHRFAQFLDLSPAQ